MAGWGRGRGQERVRCARDCEEEEEESRKRGVRGVVIGRRVEKRSVAAVMEVVRRGK